MYCTETKQAKVSYSFGGGEQRLYLNRFCPFEVRVKDGLPSRFPDWNGLANIYTYYPNEYGQNPLLYTFRCAFWDFNVLNGQGIQHWYPNLSQSNELLGFWRGDYNQLLPGAELILPVLVDSSPYTVSGRPIPATASLEIIHNGNVIYADFGPAPCFYSVKCGNGCDEDRELTVTEVSNYPGTWCLTQSEMDRLGLHGRDVKRLATQLDEAEQGMRKLKEEIEKVNDDSKTPEDEALDEALQNYLDEIDQELESLDEQENPPDTLSPLVSKLQELRDELIQDAAAGGTRVPELLREIGKTLNQIFNPDAESGTPGNGAPGSGTSGIGTPGSGGN